MEKLSRSFKQNKKAGLAGKKLTQKSVVQITKLEGWHVRLANYVKIKRKSFSFLRKETV